MQRLIEKNVKKKPKQNKEKDDEHKNSKNKMKIKSNPGSFPSVDTKIELGYCLIRLNRTARSAQLVFFETEVVCISFRSSSADVVMKSVE